MAERVPLYDEFGESYDVMVSWQERLDREEPFFRQLFQMNNAHRVLDVGCATGRHVARFAEMGLEAVGADPSSEMIRLAQGQYAPLRGGQFLQAGFGELRQKAGADFDAVTCLGNTLPHAATRPELDRALGDMAEILRPGGMLAIQQLNYDRILREKRRFLGASSGMRNGIEHLFFRFYDFEGEQITFNVVTFKKVEGSWEFRVGSTQLRAITQPELRDALEKAGFEPLQWLGSYEGEPFDPEASGDLVAIVARR